MNTRINQMMNLQKQRSNQIIKQKILRIKVVFGVQVQVQDKLIASLNDKQILVIQLQGKDWMIKQKIKVEYKGFRLSFISQDQFVFQAKTGQHLLIFNYNSQEQIFLKKQELQYQNTGLDDYHFFPIHFIPQLGLIMVKHGDNVYLIKQSQADQFKVEQSIKFDTNYIFGSVSYDGRYFATWDNKSNEIQIRKFDY